MAWQRLKAQLKKFYSDGIEKLVDSGWNGQKRTVITYKDKTCLATV